VGPGNWRSNPKASPGFFGIRGPDQDQSYGGGPNAAGSNVRPIDNAFSVYYQYETFDPAIVSAWMAQGVDPANISRFMVAWSTAWKANAAYALNGLSPQPDWMVLLHLIRMWNRAHDSSRTASVPNDHQSITGYLIPQAVAAGVASSEFSVVNMGPLRSVTVTPAAAASIAGIPATSTTTKVATAAVAAPAALALGTVVYAWATGRTIDAVFGHLWSLSKRYWNEVTRGARKNPLPLLEGRRRRRR
jgi:hypothetical protein